jgi:hypothetical protein
VAQVVKHLPSKHDALSSDSGTERKIKEGGREREREREREMPEHGAQTSFGSCNGPETFFFSPGPSKLQ